MITPRKTFGMVGAAALLAAGSIGFAASSSTIALSSTSQPSSSADLTLPAGGALAQRVTTFCQRSDEVLARLEKRQATLAEKGAERRAAAQKRIARLTERDHDKRAAAVQKRVDRRAERAAKLPERIAAVKAGAAECATLGLDS